MEKHGEKELHLAIIWQKARYKEKEIIDYISKKFQLVEQYEVSWNKKNFAKSLTSFYGTNLPPNSKKELHCGNGKFMVITFYDKSPNYEFIETSRGIENVNINIFSMKQLFREWTGGGHKIHTTNSTSETNHDLIILFGTNYEDYVKKVYLEDKLVKNEKKIIKYNPNNALGVDGWESLEKFFYAMNETLPYVVLRNFEKLPNEYISNEHGDIDLLVKDLNQTIYKTNAIKVHKDTNRVHYKINIAGKYVYFDFRSVGDNYYDENWQINILKNRRKSAGGFYIPSNEDHFYSLIYHALIHKKNISDDYPLKIKNIFKTLINYNETECNFTSYLKLLEKFLIFNGYTIVEPKDKSVYFDKKYISYKSDQEFFNEFNIKEINPYLIEEWKNFSKYIYFLGNSKDGKEYFIKSRGLAESARREFKVIEELRKENTKYFPKIYYFKSSEKINFIILEKLEGAKLSDLIEKYDLKQKTEAYKQNLFYGIYNILNILQNLKIVHRDIRPKNFIIKEDGTPILFDFQFAVDLHRKKYKEFKIVRKNSKYIKGLGGNYAKNYLHWDDAYSVIRIFEKLPFQNNPEFMKIKDKINQTIGKYEIISKKNNFLSKFLRLILNYFSASINTKIFFYTCVYKLTSNEKFKNKITKYKKKIN